MPGKNLKKPEPKRKGRRARGSSAPVPPSNLSTSTSSSSSTSSKMTTKPSSSLGPSSGAQTRGRRTNNSQKGRGSLPSATSSKPPPVTTAPPSSTSTAGNKKNGGSGSKGGNGSGPGVKAKSKKPPDYSSYTAENQTTYRPGGERERKEKMHRHLIVSCMSECECTLVMQVCLHNVKLFAFHSKTYQRAVLLLFWGLRVCERIHVYTHTFSAYIHYYYLPLFLCVCDFIDYAYVDSQQSDQPYHICLIKSFKGVSFIRSIHQLYVNE